MLRPTVVALLAGALSGCNGIFPKTQAWPWTDQGVCGGRDCSANLAIGEYQRALSFCRSVHNYYENLGNRQGTFSTSLGIVGSLAGGVISPIANGSAKTAWSGLSAVTNAGQTGVEKNFATALNANRLSKISMAMQEGSNKYFQETTANAQAARAVEMAGRCAVAASDADAKSLKALTNAETK